MATTNKRVQTFTHQGAKAHHISPYQELRRTVLSCLLWEKTFYEDGISVADRIKDLAHKVTADELAELAVEAKIKYKLRHVPLFLARELARHAGVRERALISGVINDTITRADDLTEFLSIYWAEGRQPLSGQVKKGLAKAFNKFSEYALAKYNRDKPVKLRDVLFLCHAKPKDDEQAALWKKLKDKKLETPDTWEVALSGGANKREVFTRLLTENKLGYMALLKNLRNMHESGVDRKVVENRLLGSASKSKALPFRFIAAARAVPAWEASVDKAMILALEGAVKLKGRTVLMIDHSQSMTDKLSNKSDLSRFDAACALAVLMRGICDDIRIFSFAADMNDFPQHQRQGYTAANGFKLLAEVPNRSGMALCDAILSSMKFGATQLGKAVKEINKLDYDRLVVFTDEQSEDKVPNPKKKGYLVNVSSCKNGVGYGGWRHIDGFSEAIVDYIRESESEPEPELS